MTKRSCKGRECVRKKGLRVVSPRPARVGRPYKGSFHNCLPKGVRERQKWFTQIRNVNDFMSREGYFLLLTENIFTLINILRRIKTLKNRENIFHQISYANTNRNQVKAGKQEQTNAPSAAQHRPGYFWSRMA